MRNSASSRRLMVANIGPNSRSSRTKTEELGIGFVSPDKGWVGTAVGGFETSDGGKSWRPSTLAPKATKIRVRAADGTPMIYAIGSEVQIYR